MTNTVRERITAEDLTPLEGRVLVRRALRPEKTAGGIVLPETAQSISQTGVVVKVPTISSRECPHCRERLPSWGEVKEGDVVVFSQYAASPCVATEETDLVFVRDRDILAVVEE